MISRMIQLISKIKYNYKIQMHKKNRKIRLFKIKVREDFYLIFDFKIQKQVNKYKNYGGLRQKTVLYKKCLWKKKI